MPIWIKRIFIGLFTLLFFAFLFFFIRWWIQNWVSNNPLFSSEVNAAIITGIISALTFIGMIYATIYSTQRTNKITIRDEIFRRRLEVYFKLMDYVSDMYRQVQDFIYFPTNERQEKILTLEAEVSKYLKLHRYSLSSPIYKLTFELISGAGNLVKNQRSFHRLTDDLALDKIKLLTPIDLENSFHQKYVLPFHRQFEKESGLQSIEKELHNLR
ncbi:hypothetical protein SAMN05444392_104138 [Seinonella peptonophila]|uniref:Phage abortive infection protein n=1 Tax=Seinonella peptonophila TaxID=112248 RepID=A0A1M4X5Z6_9BACL|nr:hypothetical protein [Seinonella peptonophila]SHE88803.1 hypothetical protein SAMN05444392_104138 [Seinonella peptonophila]